MPKKTQVGNLLGGISIALKGQNPEGGKVAAFLMNEQSYIPFLHTIPLFMFPSLKRARGSTVLHRPTIERFRHVADVTLKKLESASLPGMEHGLNAFAAPILNAHVVEDMFQRILIDKQPVSEAVAVPARWRTSPVTLTGGFGGADADHSIENSVDKGGKPFRPCRSPTPAPDMA